MQHPRRTAATLMTLAALLTVTIGLFTVMRTLAPFPILDTLWNASPGEIYTLLTGLTPTQQNAYRTMLLTDLLYALSYTAMFVVAFRKIRLNQGFCAALSRAGIAAALLAGAADYGENTIILLLLSRLPATTPAASLLGPVTTLKWIAVGTAGVLLALTAIARLLPGKDSREEKRKVR